MAKVEKFKCTQCGSEKYLTRDFYKSSSKMNGDTNRMNICKNCVQDKYDYYLTKYSGDAELALKHTCLNLDSYFSEPLFIECGKTDGNFLGEYFRKLNVEKATRDKTSADNSVLSEESNKMISIDDTLINQEVVDFWGESYSSKEYTKLEKKYRKYTKHYPSETLQEQEIIKNLCELEIMRENCRVNNKHNDFDKLSTQIRKAMEDLNVLPSKMQKYGNNDKITPGQLILEVEQTEPIPSKHPEFIDVDKIQWMINRYIVRPLKLFFGIETGDITYSDVENETYEDYKKQAKK